LNDEEVSSTLQMFNELLASRKTQLEKKEFEKALKIIKEIEDENSKLSDSYSLKIIRSSLHILITLIHRVKTKGINKSTINKLFKRIYKVSKSFREGV
jgi:AraC family transcriptional activator of pobA